MPSPSWVGTAIFDAMLDVLQRHLTNFSTNRVKPPHEMCTYSNRPDPEGSSLTSLCNDFLRIGHPQADLYLPAPPPSIRRSASLVMSVKLTDLAVSPLTHRDHTFQAVGQQGNIGAGTALGHGSASCTRKGLL